MIKYNVRFEFTEEIISNHIVTVLEFSFESPESLTYHRVKEKAFNIASREELPSNARCVKNFDYTSEVIKNG